MRAWLLGPLLACALVACPPPAPKPVPAPLDSDTALCEGACAGLARAGCLEARVGATPSCATVCTRSTALRAWPLRCWAAATTRDDILACGGTRCLQP